MSLKKYPAAKLETEVKMARNPYKRITRGRGGRLYLAKESVLTKKSQAVKHPVHNLQNLSRIGLGDASYNDTELVSTYQWMDQFPLFQKTPIKPNGKSGRLPSLQLLCSRVIAENVLSINSNMLKSLSSTLLKLIWNHILVSNNDSFSLFVTFASLLSSESFKCHFPLLETSCGLTTLRNQVLNDSLIPGAKNHRIVDLFNNIDIPDLCMYLRSLNFANSTFFDFSHTPKLLKRPDYIQLFKIENLAGLDFSNSEIDDSVLSLMAIAINSGKASKLRILKLENCRNVTEKGIESLLQSIAGTFNNLSLIVCDIEFNSSFHEKLVYHTGSQIPKTQWILYRRDWEEGKLLTKFPLVFQFCSLYNKFGERIPNLGNKMKGILLDFKFHDMNFEFDDPYHMLQHIAKYREINRNRLSSRSCCLMIDLSRETRPQIEEPPLLQTDSSMFFSTRAKQPKKITKRKVPKKLNIDMNSFHM